MKIEDRLEFRNKAPVLTFSPDDFVTKAVSAMSAKNYGASVIVDPDNKPVGIVTERDFMRRLLDKGLDANTTRMKDIMTYDLKIARASDEIETWIRMMSNERFRHLPVVDAQGKLVNVMSQGDFVSYTWPQLFSGIKSRAAESFAQKYQLYLIGGSIMLYTMVMIWLFRHA